MKRHKWGKSSIRRMQGLHSIIAIFAERMLQRSRYDLTVPWMGGRRNAEEQHDLFLAGNSKCDGYSKLSCHQSGCAIDLIPIVDGKASYESPVAFQYLRKLASEVWIDLTAEGLTEGYYLVCGADWGWDKPSYEIVLSL